MKFITFRGFTLIEIIVVLGVMSILTTLSLSLMNPQRQFASSRNNQRQNHVNQLAQALRSNAFDNNGYPASITTTPITIGTGVGNLNLATLLVPNYISAIPKDPSNGTDADTKYSVYLNDVNEVVVKAVAPERGVLVNSLGITNYGLTFDGTNDYVTVGSGANLNFGSGSFTYEAWVKTSVAGSNTRIVAQDSNLNNLRALVYNTSNKVEFWCRDASANTLKATTTSDLNDGKWHHIAGVRNGTSVSIFFDGVLQQTVTNAAVGSCDAATPTLIGARNGGAYFNGSIDGVRISNVARYTANFAPFKRFTNDSNTRGLWHFDEGKGTTAADESSNGYTGTLTSGPTWTSSYPPQ